jgi:hypothetical protein
MIAFFFLNPYFVLKVRDCPASFDYFNGFRRKVEEIFKSLELPGIRTGDPRVRCIAPLTTTPPLHLIALIYMNELLNERIDE